MTNSGENNNGQNEAEIGEREITDSVDVPRLFVENLGVAVEKIGRDIAEFSRNIEGYTPGRRRAALFNIDEQLSRLEVVIGDGRTLIRNHAQDLTMNLSER